MRGPVGTDIEITVRRRGERKALVFNITREKIKVSSVKSEILDNQTGYLRLTSFNENSSGQIKDKIKEFKKNFKVLQPWGKGMPKRANNVTMYTSKMMEQARMPQTNSLHK
jgi:hypothetical protein